MALLFLMPGGVAVPAADRARVGEAPTQKEHAMRIDGIVVQDAEPGRWYLLMRSPKGGDPVYLLSRTPGFTYDTHQELNTGVLGTRNGATYSAHEAIEIVRQPDGKLAYRRFLAADLADLDEAEELPALPYVVNPGGSR